MVKKRADYYVYGKDGGCKKSVDNCTYIGEKEWLGKKSVDYCVYIKK